MTERPKADIRDLILDKKDIELTERKAGQMHMERDVFAFAQAYDAMSFDERKKMEAAYAEEHGGDDMLLIGVIGVARRQLRAHMGAEKDYAAFMSEVEKLKENGADLANLEEDEREDLDEAAFMVRGRSKRVSKADRDSHKVAKDVLDWANNYVAAHPPSQQ